jgi:pSer/pThr/pTyr-binding forkhead associated (FHA) protein
VDLTTRACFRIGRSPNSDVQLLHATSSRRHALLFHHENGSCYVVDCGSAHGTYVNGVRIASPSAAVAAAGNSHCANGGGAAANGMVVPHKVKRGALIRFGGPGAPSFLLKSFNFKLEEIDRMVVSQPLSISSHATSTTTAATATPRSAVVASSEPDKGELVRRNTRINALGRTAASKVRDALFLTIDVALSVTRKRSFDSLDSRDTLDTAPSLEENDEPIGNGKRLRCSSPPPSPEEPPLRLVSPDLPQSVVRCVDSADCHDHHHHRSKRVSFSEEPPTLFYPASVTPDEPLAVECRGTTLRCGGDEEASCPHCISS